MEEKIKQIDKRSESNEQKNHPRIIIDSSYIRGMKKDGAPFRTMCEQGGHIVISDTLVRELLASDRNRWSAAKHRLLTCRDAIEVWAHVSEMYRIELKKNRPYGDPFHRERTDRLRKMLSDNPQYEPENLGEIIREARQEKEDSSIPELFQNFAGLNNQFEETSTKIKNKSPHSKEPLQRYFELVNNPDNIRSMIKVIVSVMKDEMDVSLTPKAVDEAWAIWHFSKSLLTLFCDCQRQGKHDFREISENHKKPLHNKTRDLDYLVLLAFADAIATRETRGELCYYRRWMFGDTSKPSISYFDKKRIGSFMDKLRHMSKITIYVTKQLDGYTCALDPWSRMALKIQDSETIPSSVFVAYGTEPPFGLFHCQIWKRITEILTGYPVAKLQASGRVVFVDPMTLKTLFEPSVQHA